MRIRRGRDGGFTKLETVILLVIVALLVAVAWPAFQRIRRAKMEKAEQKRLMLQER